MPREIVDRPKKGFGVPVGAWLRGPLRDMAFDLLASHRVRRDGYFDAKEVIRLIDEHDKAEADHRKQIWTLLAFQLWRERYGPGTQSPVLGDDPAAPSVPPDSGPSSSVVLRC